MNRRQLQNELVSHAAYGYWERGLSPSQEPSQKELQEIVQESTEHGVHYVIFEQNLTPKVAEMIQNEIERSLLLFII
ncbi:metal ABC transporter solute-binding protein, Zn/Mn family [Peribacillus sp. NPDC096540]|uniref:metal ABC transporter solute-binding protein, Zn/Mn family n=1 Tax=Peribacillus sp. NPDC096540 TaxID=3390612 RepID=UPI003D02CF89